MADDPDLASAQRIKEKFDFTLVAMSFAILGLAVQTQGPRAAGIAVGAELLGRVCLLVSGLAGLWSLEGVPYLIQGRVATAQDRAALAETTRLLKSGQQTALNRATHEPESLQAHKLAVEEKVRGLEVATARLQRETAAAYKVHRIGFAVGLLALTISRCYADAAWLIAVLVSPAP